MYCYVNMSQLYPGKVQNRNLHFSGLQKNELTWWIRKTHLSLFCCYVFTWYHKKTALTKDAISAVLGQFCIQMFNILLVEYCIN